MKKQLIESFGFRSIIDSRSQSWNSFTCSLFGSDKIRGEFDRLIFLFNLNPGSDPTQTDDVDDISLDAAYFGRPIKETTFHLPRTANLTDKLTVIQGLLPDFFSRNNTNKWSNPVFIVSSINETEISGYYIWQYSGVL